MAVAIKKVHAKNGIWVTAGGYEYNLTLIAVALSLATAGPGRFSVDGLLGKHRSGLRWGLLTVLLGLGGAATTLAVADRLAPVEAAFESAKATETDEKDQPVPSD
jgi:putative oxidoreductase